MIKSYYFFLLFICLGIGYAGAQTLTVIHAGEANIGNEINAALTGSGQEAGDIKTLIVKCNEGIYLVKDDYVYIKNNFKTSLEKLDLSGALFLDNALGSGKGINLGTNNAEYTVWSDPGAFTGMTALTEVVLPASTKAIYGATFQNCTKLTTIHLPDGLERIGSYAFRNCKNLVLTKLPDSITEIYQQAFTGCSEKLALNLLPASLKTIGERAFYQCSGVVLSELPDGLATIGKESLRETNVTVSQWPAAIKEIGNRSFAGTKAAFTSWPSHIPTITAGVFAKCKTITDFTIPEGVTKIDESAFYQETDIQRDFYFYGHAAPLALGASAFNGAGKLTNIHIPAEAKNSYSGIPWSDMTIRVKAVNPVTVLDGSWTKTELENLDLSEASLVNLDLSGIQLPEGTELGTIANPNCLIYVAEDATAGHWGNVVTGEEATAIRLTDGKPFFVSRPFQAASLSFELAVPAASGINDSTLTTVCLPFTVNVPSGCIALEYTEGRAEEVSFTPVNRLEANTPYVLVTNQDTISFISDEKQNIDSTIPEIVNGLYTYCGTYAPIQITGEETNNFYVSDGTNFIRTEPGTIIAPFRAYLKGEKEGPEIILFTRGNPTNIDQAAETDGLKFYVSDEVLIVESPVRKTMELYSIDGRTVRKLMLTEGINRIGKLQKGIYIAGHQKIMIK